MSEKSVLEMVGGKKHINPHYNIKAERIKTNKNCPNCPAFGKHCPHKVNGDPYHYDCTMTIAELEQKLEQTEKDLADYQFNYPTIKELQKENAELKSENQKWKDEWQEQVQKATDEGYARTLQTIQLTKATELLKEFVQHYKAKTIYVENMQDLLKQTEQFLSEVEK